MQMYLCALPYDCPVYHTINSSQLETKHNANVKQNEHTLHESVYVCGDEQKCDVASCADLTTCETWDMNRTYCVCGAHTTSPIVCLRLAGGVQFECDTVNRTRTKMCIF